MKKILYILLIAPIFSLAQVGINTTTPAAQLDIKSSNQATPANTDGLLIPKVDAFPVINPSAAQKGMLVYLTTTSGTNPPGFYYWNNPGWVGIVSGSAGGTLDQAYDFGGAGAGKTITADTGAVTIAGTDGLVSTGTAGSGAVAPSGPGTKMVWNPRKSAFRAGQVSASQWDDVNLGSNSVAFGSSTRASGIGASAFGSNTIASGGSSTAFGSNSVSSGSFSTAFGNSTTASGQFSTAFGSGTSASGDYSNAFGLNTIASAIYATTFGEGTRASSNHATAFGQFTLASSGGATSFGVLTTASGNNSTAFGFATTASGTTSSSFGDNTVAAGTNSLAIGANTNASGAASNAFGKSNTASSFSETVVGIGATTYTPSTNGATQFTAANATDRLLVVGNAIDADSNGGVDAAERRDALVILKNGLTRLPSTTNTMITAADGKTVVTKEYLAANSSGTLDQAYDFGGAGAGRTITADTGSVTIAGTDGLVSTGTIGSGALTPSGAGTRMVWNPNKGAFRAGNVSGTEWDNVNVGFFSIALGLNSTASADNSTALGVNTVASNFASTAMGRNSTASGTNSTAMGFATSASNAASTAMGSGTTASANSSTAMGSGTTASANSSTAMGDSTTASGASSTAMGKSTLASGSTALVGGFENVAPSFGETVIGVGATSYTPSLNGETQFRPANGGDRLLVVGNAIDLNSNNTVDALERRDALVILKNGNTGIGSSTPQEKLHVVGKIRMVDGNQAAGRILTSDANGSASWQAPVTPVETDPQVSATIIGRVPRWNGATMVDGALYDNGANVGIGTATPLDRLHVVGNIRMVDGNQGAGKVLTSDAGGMATWQSAATAATNLDGAYDFGGSGAGRTITADAGAVTIAGSDGLVSTGTVGSGASSPFGAGTRMVWNPRKAAFRAGNVQGSQWDDSSVGLYSCSFGVNSISFGQGSLTFGQANQAIGNQSFAFGDSNVANGTSSTAFGISNTANGNLSTTFGTSTISNGDFSLCFGRLNQANGENSICSGINNFASSFGEVVLGLGATTYTPSLNGATQFRSANATDRLLVIGNAIDTNGSGFVDLAERSDAMVILKNGNTGIGSSTPQEKLHVVGNIRMVDGNQAAGKVLTSDANGTATWTAAGTLASGTLDQAYDFGGAGAGRTITADAGAVTIAGTDGLTVAGNSGFGVAAPVARMQFQTTANATKTLFTQGLLSSGLLATTNFVNGNFTPGLFWNTTNNNVTLPKAGIFLQTTNAGSSMYLGTSNSYATGITNDGIVIDPSGNVGIANTAPATKIHVNGGLTMSPDPSNPVALSSPAALTVGDRSFVRMGSNSTPALRIVAPTAGLAIGQMLVIECTAAGVNGLRFTDTATTNTSGVRDLLVGDTITFIWNGTQWLEINYSDN